MSDQLASLASQNLDKMSLNIYNKLIISFEVIWILLNFCKEWQIKLHRFSCAVDIDRETVWSFARYRRRNYIALVALRILTERNSLGFCKELQTKLHRHVCAADIYRAKQFVFLQGIVDEITQACLKRRYLQRVVE